MKPFSYILLFFLCTLSVSCEDTINVDLHTEAPRLVIDAGIEWVKGTDGNEQAIKLSTTTGYYENEVPPVSNATVYITNSEGTIFDFEETPGTGVYVCTDFIPVIAENYTLTVILGEQTYTATEQLMAVPEITRVEHREEGGFLGEDNEVRFYFRDNGEEDNFYLSRFDVDFLAYPWYRAFTDEFTQGNETFESFSHEDLEKGHHVDMRLYGISRRFYNYMFLILSVSDSNPFSIPAANIKGNIVNQTDENNYPYGYFRLSEVDKASIALE